MSKDEDQQPNKESKDSFFVVGIGASAGGLRALEEFFDHIPPDSGAAFVVIQHLSPDFKSMMKELLERRTKMEVRRVEESIAIEPNTINLITPRNNLVIKNKRLHSIEQDKQLRQKPHFPINLFLESLAEDCGSKAIGVILSGTGSDGSRGLQSISEAGGLAFVQSPSTSEFDGMPQSAIATGLVDGILSPRDLASTIYEIVTKKLTSPETMPLDELEPAVIKRVVDILNSNEQLDFSYYKPSTLSRRIYRRCSLGGFGSLEDYIAKLETSQEERSLLRDDLLIGVTRLFRDGAAWELLQGQIIKGLDNLEPEQQFRVWVTACSTGEEAYSMAIAVQEAMLTLGRMPNYKIFATDIDTEALGKASAGVYPESIISDISVERLERYFIPKNGTFQVSRKLRESIVFAPHNLAKNAGFSRMHLISCRNVLIYMQPQLQQLVLRMLHFSLEVNGILFLGAAETPGELGAEFNTLHEKWKIYTKRRSVRLPLFPDSKEYPLVAPKILATAQAPPVNVRFDPILDEAFSSFLKERKSTCLIVNREGELIHVVADGAHILQVPMGRSNQTVTAMMPIPLQLPLNTALHRARGNNNSVIYNGIKIEDDRGERVVSLKVSYRETVRQRGDFLMVTVEIEERGPQTPVSGEKFHADAESQQRIFDLEYELQQIKENLQATIEELETTNEEQQATNEELLASNEELQSTNEELHSVNEELYTVNTEYQSKIQQLTELSNDIDNLLRNTNIGVIFLDRELKIRKFTPAAKVLVNILDSDIDRPLEHITHNLNTSKLVDWLNKTIATQKPLEREVQVTKTGDWFLMRVNPYVLDDEYFDGLVVTFVNINDIKKASYLLDRQTKELENLYATSPVGFGLIDEDFQFVRVNQALADINGLSMKEHFGKKVREIIPQMAKEHETQFLQVLETSEPIVNLELSGQTPAAPGVNRDWIGSYFPVEMANGCQGISLVVTEITEFKKAQRALSENEQYLKYLLTSSPAVIFSRAVENDTRVTFISENVREVLGYEASEFLADSEFWASRIHPEDIDRLLLDENDIEQESYSTEYRCLHADGNYRWLYVELKKVLAEDQMPKEWVGFLVDISDRKQVEAALEHQLQRALVLKQITDEIRESLEAERIFQTAASQIGIALQVHRCLIYTHEESRQSAENQKDLQKVRGFFEVENLQSEESSVKGWEFPVELFYQGSSHQGSSHQGNSHQGNSHQGNSHQGSSHQGNSHQGNSDGENGQLLLTEEEALAIDDVYAEKQFAKTTPVFRRFKVKSMLAVATFFKGKPNGIIVLHHCFEEPIPSPTGRTGVSPVPATNPSATKSDQLPSDKLGNDPPPRNRVSSRNPVSQDLINYRERRWTPEEVEMLEAIASQMGIAIAQAQLLETEKQQREALTEQNQALERATYKAETAKKAQTEFLANMSHEIRTPMNAILGFADLLDNMVTQEKARPYLNSIISSGKTLLALINDILDLSKIEAGKLNLSYESFNLRLLIQEIKQIFQQKADQKRLLLRTEIDESLPEAIVFDEVRLRQILFNVVGNALKFTEKGWIKISVDLRKAEGEQLQSDRFCLEISVADTGIGIFPEQQQRIFDPFTQSQGQNSRKYGGTGLGLNITLRLTEMLGGRVELTSEPRKGSVFTFIFPDVAIATWSPKSPVLDVDKDLNRFQKATLLVVDDVQSNRDLIEGYFAETEHQLLMAEEGLTAINLAVTQHPDLIILDLRMPVMDGSEVARELKQNQETKDIPIIIATASILQEEAESLRPVYDSFLRKPFSRSQLAGELMRFLPLKENYSPTCKLPEELPESFSLPAEMPVGPTERLPELLERLLDLEETVLPSLSQTMKMRDLADFAGELQELGRNHNSALLLDYVNILQSQIDEFDWNNLPETIKSFGDVRRTIEAII